MSTEISQDIAAILWQSTGYVCINRSNGSLKMKFADLLVVWNHF